MARQRRREIAKVKLELEAGKTTPAPPNTNGTEPNESATPTAINEAVEETGTVSPRKAGHVTVALPRSSTM